MARLKHKKHHPFSGMSRAAIRNRFRSLGRARVRCGLKRRPSHGKDQA